MRVLQVGYGIIGREVFGDYGPALAEHGHRYMVTDLVAPLPSGGEWDGEPVDLAVILVNTPAAHGGGFDYADLDAAVAQYLQHADFVLIRSTVSLDYLDTGLYRANAARIGFSPEFYGATKWSRRSAFEMGFSIFTWNTPTWFLDAVGDPMTILGGPAETIAAKLAENAYLATKVTFFHELALSCEERGIDPEIVRLMVTADPRIGQAHSFMEEPGWSSHCFDKDVPEYAHALGSDLVRQAILVNRARLLPERDRPDPFA